VFTVRGIGATVVPGPVAVTVVDTTRSAAS
jgi:hypothetical protein